MISSLTQECIWSPNYYPGRVGVKKVTVHHMAGDLSIWSCGMVFQNPSRSASSNYGVDSQGRIACYVDEDNTAWTSSSYWNDSQAITIEVADEDTTNWVPSKKAYRATVDLCADICNRYGITPTYTGDIDGSFTEHLMFAATGCPGEWWHSHMQQFVKDVIETMGDDMATAEDVWGYDWEGTAPQGNMYNCNVAIFKMVESMERKIDSLNAKIDKIQSGNVDYAKLAKAVNDDMAARMKQ